tara:strand:- start:4169 stop:5080 length:912 start_codon:yes stop_codon:yes gene_type:complete
MKTIGIIGPGKHFSQKIYPVLKNSNFFKISGILRKRNLDFKNVRKFNERQFFLNNFDFVYIASPNKSHEKYIIKSLNSGFNVICEKPFVISKKNINKIVNLSIKKNKLIFEAFMYFYHPVFKYIETLIKRKRYGKIIYLISNFRFPSIDKSNNRYKKNEGNGFLFDAASYLVSFDNYFFKKKKFFFSSQKIKDKVDLRGNFFVNSSGINRYYFWGEGQNYSNNLEIFFKNGFVYIDKFFSKKKNEQITAKIISKNKTSHKYFKKFNHFELMFSHIAKNYKSKKFLDKCRKQIRNQIDFLSKSF